MNKTLNKAMVSTAALVFVACMALQSGVAHSQAAAPAKLTELVALADMQYAQKKYDDYVDTCRRIGKIKPGFVSDFNIALGLYRAGKLDESRTQVSMLKKRGEFTAVQKSRLDALSDKLSPVSQLAVTKISVHMLRAPPPLEPLKEAMVVNVNTADKTNTANTTNTTNTAPASATATTSTAEAALQ